MSGESYRRQGRKAGQRKRVSFPQPRKVLGPPEAYAFATCPDCGKKGYTSKQEAKQAARVLYPGNRMRVYECGTLWHMTSQDAEAAARYRKRHAAMDDQESTA